MIFELMTYTLPPHRNFDFNDVQVSGAQRIAEISKANGVSRFVHVSHLNASHDSPSAFYRSKAAGEEAVREVFPEASIVRPAGFYGHEDKLLNSMACEFNLLPSHSAHCSRLYDVLD